MRRLSSQFIITNTGDPLKRAVITTDDDGEIINIENNDGNIHERYSTEFYNGIIIPGFVNCHCHLELSHLKGSIARGGGLDDFLERIRTTRPADIESILASAFEADREMCRTGTVLCADVCNTSTTFDLKTKSGIRYINLIEVFGIDPEKAEKRMNEIYLVAEAAEKRKLPYAFVPHSAYAMSLTLLRLLRAKSEKNKVTSLHFMETPDEVTFLEIHSGPLMDSYRQSGLINSEVEPASSHSDAVLNEITRSGNLILVHNTFVNRSTIREVRKRGDLFWCLCPNSNIFIEDTVPPLPLLLEECCEIVIGTDSLASNTKLEIMEELKTLQRHYPSLTIEELVYWSTLNGARALGEENRYGTIEPGKKPGLLLIQNVDMLNMKLMPESFVTRLI